MNESAKVVSGVMGFGASMLFVALGFSPNGSPMPDKKPPQPITVNVRVHVNNPQPKPLFPRLRIRDRRFG